MMLTLSVALACLLGCAWAIPIDNGLEGDPEVQCGPSTILVSFAAQREFQGIIYAKGHHSVDGCSAFGDGRQGGSLELDFQSCNSRRTRSLEPKGIFVSITIVIQFHQSVLTKVDRAFHVQCFYMEADKTVDQQLEVSMVTTDLVTFTVPMPVCRYEILDGGPDGTPVSFVTIGQKVYHKWTCDSETIDTFCMEVYGCTVDDGLGTEGSTLELLDFQGCALDKNLLDNLDYSTDLMGGQETHVFKYADRPQLYFNCQIRIGVKEPGSDCRDWREENGACPEALETLGRKKRAAKAPKLGRRKAKDLGFLDVTPKRPIFVADIELTQNDVAALQLSSPPLKNVNEAGECMAGAGFSLLLLVLVGVFGLLSLGFGIALCLRRS